MQTKEYADYKEPIPVKSRYELRIATAEYFVGKNEDDNGEVSVGMSFRYEIMGPQEAVMDNGDSAIGYQISELILEPKKSSSPKYVQMCKSKWKSHLTAVFGDNIPEEVEPEDFYDKIFVAQVTPKFSDYDQRDMPQISFRAPLVIE